VSRGATPAVAPPGLRTWAAPTVVVGLALGLRLAHVLALRDSPYFDRPVLDAYTYYAAARMFAAGEGWPERIYWQPPGYPYFLALVLWLAGPGLLVPRLVQAIVGSLTAGLTCAIGRRLFGPAVGLGAGLIVAAYGLLIYFDGELLTPSLGVALQMATLYCAVSAPGERARRGWFAAGLLAGVTATVNATALALVPVLGAAARRRAGWLLLGVAIALAPLTLRNWLQGGELVLISSNAGINLYLGNNPRYDATVGMRPGRDWQALLRAPRLHGVTGAGPASRFFVRRVLDYARQDPGGFLRLQARKVRLLLAGTEVPRNQEIYPARAWSPVLRLLLWKVPGVAFPFGVLLPCAVLGLCVGWGRAPLLGWAVLMLALTVVGFFVTGRYRVGLVPLLALFAAEGVRWATVVATPRQRLGAAALAFGVYALANLGQGPMPVRMNPDADEGLARWIEREGRREEALAIYERLARETPGSFDAWYSVARLSAALDRPGEVARALAAIRAIEPAFPDTALLLARVAAAAGCSPEALAYARRAVQLDPQSPLARELLARATALHAARPADPPGGCPAEVLVAPMPWAPRIEAPRPPA
jgi:hypothetical protein